MAAMQRQRGQAKCRHPDLGTAVQAGNIAFAQAQLIPVTQKHAGLRHAEAQGIGTDLQQLAAGTDAPEPDGRRGARGDHQTAAGRQRGQYLLEQVEYGRTVDRLELIEQDREWLLAAAQLLQ
ncbi:hypothetical protein D9M70_550250 [compost metagenome]